MYDRENINDTYHCRLRRISDTIKRKKVAGQFGKSLQLSVLERDIKKTRELSAKKEYTEGDVHVSVWTFFEEKSYVLIFNTRRF